MQVFEVFETESSPYMEAKEIFAETVKDLIDDSKVLILIDHDDKKIWTYFGTSCSLKLQIYGGILAKKFRSQLRLFYRVININERSLDDKTVKEILERKVGAGRAQAVTSENYDNFSVPGENVEKIINLCVHKGIKKKDAIEQIQSLPKPENHKSKFLIIAGDFFSYESEVKSFVVESDERESIKKIGKMPNGFFFDNSHNYSIRLVIKGNLIQGIEYFVPSEEEVLTEKLEVPIFFEERFKTPGDINTVLKSFNIPEDLAQKTSEEVSEPDGE